MKNEFIPYEQALELKKLKFNEPCFAHYNPNGVFFWKIMCSSEDEDHTLSIDDILNHFADGYIEAPLYNQAFKWFRQHHGLEGIAQKSDSCSWYKFSCYDCSKEPKICLTLGVELKTYDDAELALLKKLIEIVKNR